MALDGKGETDMVYKIVMLDDGECHVMHDGKRLDTVGSWGEASEYVHNCQMHDAFIEATELARKRDYVGT